MVFPGIILADRGYLSAFKNDRRGTIARENERKRKSACDRERESNYAIIVAARYIIRTFANLLARGHPRALPGQDDDGGGGGDPAWGPGEYVPCVSDFIISVRRNVRADESALEGFNAGHSTRTGERVLAAGINERGGRKPAAHHRRRLILLLPLLLLPPPSPVPSPRCSAEEMDEVREEPAGSSAASERGELDRPSS